MAGADVLQGLFDSGRLVRPSANVPNFVDLIRALFSLAGGEGIKLGPGAKEVSRKIGPADHYVFIFIDGLGINLLNQLPADGFLRTHLAGELLAVFPSATAAALTTVATGQWPGAHGVPTWWVYLKEFDTAAVTLPFTERYSERPLTDLGIRREDVFGLPSIWSRIKYSLLTLVRSRIRDSVFTTYATSDAERVGYEEFPDALETIRTRVLRASRPTFAYIYLPDLDHLCHQKGTDCDEVHRLVSVLDDEIGNFCDALGRRARVVTSADHGEVNTPEDRRFVVYEDDPLMEYLRFLPTGEPTVPIFHVKRGSKRAFLKAFSSRFGEAFLLITPDEAERMHLFGPGPLSPTTRERLGSFIGIAPEPAAVYFRPRDSTGPIHVGVHGGLSPAEMRVPLILA